MRRCGKELFKIPLRLFIALNLPQPQQAELAVLQQRMKQALDRVRPVGRTNLHLTLKFLGDTEAKAIPAIRKIVTTAAAAFPPFPVVYGGIAVLPSPGKARVIAVGLKKGADRLSELAGRLEKDLQKLGFPAETRPFKAHLTIGRLSHPPGQDIVAAFSRREEPFSSSETAATTIILFQSTLLPQGPVYTCLHRAALGSNGDVRNG